MQTLSAAKDSENIFGVDIQNPNNANIFKLIPHCSETYPEQKTQKQTSKDTTVTKLYQQKILVASTSTNWTPKINELNNVSAKHSVNLNIDHDSTGEKCEQLKQNIVSININSLSSNKNSEKQSSGFVISSSVESSSNLLESKAHKLFNSLENLLNEISSKYPEMSQRERVELWKTSDELSDLEGFDKFEEFNNITTWELTQIQSRNRIKALHDERKKMLNKPQKTYKSANKLSLKGRIQLSKFDSPISHSSTSSKTVLNELNNIQIETNVFKQRRKIPRERNNHKKSKLSIIRNKEKRTYKEEFCKYLGLETKSPDDDNQEVNKRRSSRIRKQSSDNKASNVNHNNNGSTIKLPASVLDIKARDDLVPKNSFICTDLPTPPKSKSPIKSNSSTKGSDKSYKQLKIAQEANTSSIVTNLLPKIDSELDEKKLEESKNLQTETPNLSIMIKCTYKKNDSIASLINLSKTNHLPFVRDLVQNSMSDPTHKVEFDKYKSNSNIKETVQTRNSLVLQEKVSNNFMPKNLKISKSTEYCFIRKNYLKPQNKTVESSSHNMDDVIKTIDMPQHIEVSAASGLNETLELEIGKDSKIDDECLNNCSGLLLERITTPINLQIDLASEENPTNRRRFRRKLIFRRESRRRLTKGKLSAVLKLAGISKRVLTANDLWKIIKARRKRYLTNKESNVLLNSIEENQCDPLSHADDTDFEPNPIQHTNITSDGILNSSISLDKSHVCVPNPLNKMYGKVVHAFYICNVLVVVQKTRISFWKYSMLTQMLDKPLDWDLIGDCTRKNDDDEVQSPYKNRICISESSPIYVEMRANQFPVDQYRECNLVSVYVNIYFCDEPNKTIAMFSVHLDNIQGLYSDILYTTITNTRYFIMCWKQEDKVEETKTGLCKYALTPDLDTLASIRDFRHMRHVVLQLECLNDEKLIGFGDAQVTIWNHHTGDVLKNLDLKMPIGFNLGSVLHEAEFIEYLLLYQIRSNDHTEIPELNVMALNLGQNPFSFRHIHTHTLSSSFANILSSLCTENFLIATASNGDELLLLPHQPNRIIITPNSDSTQANGIKRYFSTDCHTFVEISNNGLTSKTIHEYLIDLIQ